MDWKLLIILAATLAMSWWLGGFDTRFIREDGKPGYRRRAVRSAVTVLLVGVAVSALMNHGIAGGWFFLVITVPLGLLWAGCLSELCAGGFNRLVDPHDERQFDSKQLPRDLDQLAFLIQAGRSEQAIQLSRLLTESGEVSVLAMEALLFRIYSRILDFDRIRQHPPLVKADRLCAHSQLAEAEAELNSFLRQQPGNATALLMLLRLYARDSQSAGRADTLLQTLKRRGHTPPAFIEYARLAIHEWSGKAPVKETVSEGIESLLVPTRHAYSHRQSD